MFLNINRNTLLVPLTLVTGFIDKKHTMPILSNIYLKKSAEELVIIANDMEIQVSIVTKIQIPGEDFAITLPGKKLQEILKTFPEGTEITFENDGDRVLIKSGKVKFTIQSLDVEHYPLLKITDSPICEFSMEQSELKNLIAQIQYAMADKDSRIFLNGMYFEIKNGMINFVATNAHRLGFASHTLNLDVDNCGAIIPRKSITELYRLLEDKEQNVKIKIYPNQVVFETLDKTLITKIIDGKYPDYERVIPLNNDKLCLIEREALLKAVDRVAVIGIDKLKTITLNINNNQMLVLCSNDDHEESQIGR